MSDGAVVIRPCTLRDLAELEAWSPTSAVDLSHDAWLGKQDAGEISYLLGFLNGRIVGSAKIRWIEPRLPAHRPVPELFQFGVWPEEYRDRGVGTALIALAEELARERAVPSLTMGVGVDNHAARRLYERLGYRDWGQGVVEDRFRAVDDSGNIVLVTDKITYVVKDFGRPRARAG